MSREIETKPEGMTITERPPANPAVRWLDGEISLGKLLQSLEVSRPGGDNLAGALWQAFHEKIETIRLELQRKHDFAEKSLKEALEANNHSDACAESASRLAYTTSLAYLRRHLGRCIENTEAPK